MWLSWSKWWWEQGLHLADLCRRGSWRLRRESFRPLPWGVASIDKNCRQFQNFWIGPDGSALGSLESASEFDWRWRWGTLTCRNHCCMSMGFRSLIKIIRVLILLNWKGWGLSAKLGKHSAIWKKLGTALQAYALNPCTKFPPNPTSRKVKT